MQQTKLTELSAMVSQAYFSAYHQSNWAQKLCLGKSLGLSGAADFLYMLHSISDAKQSVPNP